MRCQIGLPHNIPEIEIDPEEVRVGCRRNRSAPATSVTVSPSWFASQTSGVLLSVFLRDHAGPRRESDLRTSMISLLAFDAFIFALAFEGIRP